MPNNQSGPKKGCNTCSSSTAPTITPSSTIAGSVPLETPGAKFGEYQSTRGGYRKTRRSRRKHKRSRRVR